MSTRESIHKLSRDINAGELFLVRAAPSRRAPALRLSRVQRAVFDDAIARDVRVLSAQRRGDRALIGPHRATTRSDTWTARVQRVLRRALGFRPEATPARMGGHAEPVREVRLPRQGLVGSAPPDRFPVDAPALARVGNAASAYTRFAYSYARSAKKPTRRSGATTTPSEAARARQRSRAQQPAMSHRGDW